MGRRTDQERGAELARSIAYGWSVEQLFPMPVQFLAVVNPMGVVAAANYTINECHALRAAQVAGE